MAWYRTGTVTVTNGSTTVTGASTAWVANVGIGEGLLAPDGRIYEITEVVSNTSLKISPAYLGSGQSGQAYTIVPTQSYIRDLAAQAADLINRYDMSSFGQDFSKASNQNQALQKLGLDNLGTAATRDATTSATDNTSGRVVSVQGNNGWMGLGGSAYPMDNFAAVVPSGFVRGTKSNNPELPSDLPGSSSTFQGAIAVKSSSSFTGYLLIPAGLGGSAWKGGSDGSSVQWHMLLDTGNTTVDGSGFIKEASPIIELYDDRIDAKGFHNETPSMTKLNDGVYQITGTSGLAQKGWYIETPQDRNGNKYFNCDWEQDVTPEVDDDGMVDESADVTLTIRTYERVWNPATGLWENGDPVDIEHRFISLRFVEVRQDDDDEDVTDAE
ncbi:hypothetical protein [Orrella sp. 11846]|uniref:phage tail fiber protein n=1 Tax=Orrella sp. 11846 TaxID=3409913 RepID=UPI003B5C3F34